MSYDIVELTWEFEDKKIIQKFVEVGRILFPLQISSDIINLPNIKDKKKIGQIDFIPPSKFKYKNHGVQCKGGPI